MDLVKDILLLVIGFVLLVKGADFFVDGSSAVAKLLKIPSIIVGLTIVAMGTSLPELAVSLTAAVNGSNEIAVSNVVGSNIFNLIVALGVCAVLSPITVDKGIVKREFPFSIIMTVLVAVLMADNFLPLAAEVKSQKVENCVGMLGRMDGLILLVFFIAFMVYTVLTALNQRKNMTQQEEDDKKPNVLLAIIFIVGGVAAIKFGGEFVVNSASSIAKRIGMTDTLVGLTIVSIGTSLPELVTSVVAAKKGETGLAVGNVVGSNIFNLLLILGVSSAIHPIIVGMDALIDFVILSVTSILVYIFTRSKNVINRGEGIIMVLIYAAYMIYAIIR